MAVLFHSNYSARTKQLEKLITFGHRRRYAARSTLVYAGDNNENLFCILKGSVTLFIEDKNGREIILDYLNPGDFFGEKGLFNKTSLSASHFSNPHNEAWVRAKYDCEVIEIPHARFRELIQHEPEWLYTLCNQMSERMCHFMRKVNDLAFLDVTGRVAHTLHHLCKQPDAVTHPDGMQIKITRQEIGRIVGCSREMVGRVLKSLEQRGIASVQGKTMVVFGTR